MIYFCSRWKQFLVNEKINRRTAEAPYTDVSRLWVKKIFKTKKWSVSGKNSDELQSIGAYQPLPSNGLSKRKTFCLPPQPESLAFGSVSSAPCDERFLTSNFSQTRNACAINQLDLTLRKLCYLNFQPNSLTPYSQAKSHSSCVRTHWHSAIAPRLATHLAHETVIDFEISMNNAYKLEIIAVYSCVHDRYWTDVLIECK